MKLSIRTVFAGTQVIFPSWYRAPTLRANTGPPMPPASIEAIDCDDETGE